MRHYWRIYVKLAVCGALAMFMLVTGLTSASPQASDAPKHVLTWAYDGQDGGQTDGSRAYATTAASKRHVQTWLSFADGGNVGQAPQKAYYDCPPGSPCKQVVYYRPTKLFERAEPDRDFLSQNSSEDYYLHDGSPASQSNRTTRQQGRSVAYFPNLNNPAVGQWFARLLQSTMPQNNNTILFQDVSRAECRGRFHPGQRYAPYELQGGSDCDESLAASIRNVANQMRWRDGTPVPVVVNGLSIQPEVQIANVASVKLIAPGSNVIGGTAEDSAIVDTTYAPRATFGEVNTASLVYAKNPNALYVLLGDGKSPVGSDQPCTPAARNDVDCGAVQQRRNFLATFWLVYNERRSVLWENFFTDHENHNHIFMVYPEASIYPTEPIQQLKTFNTDAPTTDGSGCGAESGSGGIQSYVVACGSLSDGRTPAGMYVREFRKCYNFGELVGAGQCAVVMNTTNAAVTVANNWLRQEYNSSMTFGTGSTDGADVLTAGCGDDRCPTRVLNPLGAAFSAGRTTVPAFDALFLFHS